MILKPLLFYIKVVQVIVKKKISTSKTWVCWGVGVGDKINRPGQLTPTHVPISFFFSDIENKFTGLVL